MNKQKIIQFIKDKNVSSIEYMRDHLNKESQYSFICNNKDRYSFKCNIRTLNSLIPEHIELKDRENHDYWFKSVYVVV